MDVAALELLFADGELLGGLQFFAGCATLVHEGKVLEVFVVLESSTVGYLFVIWDEVAGVRLFPCWIA